MDTEKQDTILVVDDERGVRESFNMVLKDKYRVLLAQTGQEAIDIFVNNPVDLVLLDILLPDANGLDLLARIKDITPTAEVVMVTAVKEIQSAVKAIKSGAYEYIIKPFEVDEVLTTIDRALEKRRLVKEVAYLRHELERYHFFEEMVGQHKKMKDIFGEVLKNKVLMTALLAWFIAQMLKVTIGIIKKKKPKVILFGEAADLIEDALNKSTEGNLPYSLNRAGSFADAVHQASLVVEEGEAVLLSPGGTSFDAYKDFAQRGVHFKSLVMELAAKL